MHKRVIVVILSVCLSVYPARSDLTINRWFRYELTQNKDLGPFIVLLL